MPRKDKKIDWDAEAPEVDAIRERVGKPVSLRTYYVRGEKPILVAIEKDRGTLRFANGVIMLNVPLRDLVDDFAFWK